MPEALIDRYQIKPGRTVSLAKFDPRDHAGVDDKLTSTPPPPRSCYGNPNTRRIAFTPRASGRSSWFCRGWTPPERTVPVRSASSTPTGPLGVAVTAFKRPTENDEKPVP